jgi:dihydroflavonol-4-reductase
MRVLVTGSTGFIGSQLCQALCRQGYQVLAFHRPTSSLRGLEGLPVEHILGDITQPASLEAALQGVQIVFHVAALLGWEGDPKRVYTVTVNGTRNVLQAALQAGVNRLIHTSSVAALGIPAIEALKNNRIPLLDENHTWNCPPGWYTYGHAKYQAELEVQKAVAKGLDVVTLNPSGVFGAGDVYRQSNSVILQVARGRVPVSITGGWNVIHVDDVTAGHLVALEHGRKGERYILSSQNLTFHYFLQMIAEVTGSVPPRIVLPTWTARLLAKPIRLVQPFIELPASSSLLGLAGRHFYYTSAKAERDLGWRPTRTARQAIEEAYAWFCNPQREIKIEDRSG